MRKMTKRLIVSRYDFRIAIRFRIACLKKTFCKKYFYHYQQLGASLTCGATAPSCRRAKLPTNAMNLRCFGHPPDLQRPGRVLLPHRAHGNSIPADVVQAVERRARGDGPGIVYDDGDGDDDSDEDSLEAEDQDDDDDNATLIAGVDADDHEAAAEAAADAETKAEIAGVPVDECLPRRPIPQECPPGRPKQWQPRP